MLASVGLGLPSVSPEGSGIGGSERGGAPFVYSDLISIDGRRGDPSFGFWLKGANGETQLFQFALEEIVNHEETDGDGYYQPGEARGRIVESEWKIEGPGVRTTEKGTTATMTYRSDLSLVLNGGPIRDFATLSVSLTVADYSQNGFVEGNQDALLDTNLVVTKADLAQSIALVFRILEAPHGETDREIDAPGREGRVRLKSGVESGPTAVPIEEQWGVSAAEIAVLGGDSIAHFTWANQAIFDHRYAIGFQAVKATHWSTTSGAFFSFAHELGPTDYTLIDESYSVGVNPLSEVVQEIRTGIESLSRNLTAFGAGLAAAAALFFVLALRAAGKRPEFDLRSHPLWRGPKPGPEKPPEAPAGPVDEPAS
jgi:hypothetical protein